MQNPDTDIASVIDSVEEKRIARNRALLRPMVQTMLYLARCELAFRGHDCKGFKMPKDDGNIDSSRGILYYNSKIFSLIK